MGKFGSTIKELTKIKFDELNCSKKKLDILSDVYTCINKYDANYNDYKLFEMYNLNETQRETIITSGINKQLIEEFNNVGMENIYNNYLDFYKKYNKFLLRDWLPINEDNYEEYKQFVDKNPCIIAKKNNNECIYYKISPKNKRKVFDELLEKEFDIIEEQTTQCSELESLTKENINIIRIITLNNQIVAAYLNIIDNDNNLIAPINLETGIVDYLAVDNKGNSFERVPSTNESILWFNVPKWPRIKRFALNLASSDKKMNYMEWNISLNKDPYLISASTKPNHNIYQLPQHRTNGIGLLPIFKKAMEEKNENSYSNRP